MTRKGGNYAYQFEGSYIISWVAGGREVGGGGVNVNKKKRDLWQEGQREGCWGEQQICGQAGLRSQSRNKGYETEVWAVTGRKGGGGSNRER